MRADPPITFVHMPLTGRSSAMKGLADSGAAFLAVAGTYLKLARKHK
jgi:hypothetical protein